MQRRRPQRLSRRLARSTVTLAALIGGLIGFIQILLDYADERSVFDREIQAAIAISEVPAVQIAYNIDTRLAGELLQGLLQHPAIVRAEIADGDGHVLALREKAFAEGRFRAINDWLFGREHTYTIPLVVPELPDSRLGRLHIVADTYPAGTQFLQRSGVNLLSIVMMCLVLSLALFVVFYLLLTKPLLSVIASTRSVDPERPEKARLPIPEGHAHDEIGDLVNATNTHLALIDLNLDKLRQAEGRLKNYSERLEQEVQQRTLELSEKNRELISINQDLVVAKEEAVTKAKSRADFLASMSHEIRTPFNGVLGMISLTLEEPLSPKQKEQLTIAYNSGRALLALLNDILDISKVESGKLELEHIAYSLPELCEDVVRLMAPTAHARGIALYVDLNPDFPRAILGDPTRMRQILTNLVGNAVKFTEQGYVEVRLRIVDEQVVLDVEDTGIGIEPSQRSAIFSPFTQANAHITRRFGGTGLGLTLCRQLVNKMQGQLSLDSQLGVGSTFTVRLPLHVSPPPATQEALTQSVRETHYYLVFHQDNRTHRALARLLQSWGLSCETRLYQQIDEINWSDLRFTNPACLLIDTRSFVPLIADHPQRHAFRVILVARQHIPSDATVFERMGISRLITAPISREHVLKALKETLAGERLTSIVDENPTTPSVPSRQILLVEDNQVNQMVARSMLTRMGHRIRIASNGREAVDEVLQHPFDLILMDCHMPEVDGFEAARRIRAYPQFDRIPIIALTANVMQGDRERCLEAGMNDYMTKPYDRQTLTAMLDRWLAPAPERP